VPAFTGTPGLARVTVFGGPRVAFDVDLDPAKLRAIGSSAREVADAIAVRPRSRWLRGRSCAAESGCSSYRRKDRAISVRLPRSKSRTAAGPERRALVARPRARPRRVDERTGFVRCNARGHHQRLSGGIGRRRAPQRRGRTPSSGLLRAFCPTTPTISIGVGSDATDRCIAGRSARRNGRRRADRARDHLSLSAQPRADARWPPQSSAARDRTDGAGLVGAGLSLNLMTLGGLAIAIGLVIDEAIVVVEAIARETAVGERRGSKNVDRARGAQDRAPARRRDGRERRRLSTARLPLRHPGLLLSRALDHARVRARGFDRAVAVRRAAFGGALGAPGPARAPGRALRSRPRTFAFCAGRGGARGSSSSRPSGSSR
jgi:hypothetical protein